jgi:predicted metal-dependent hydrolase
MKKSIQLLSRTLDYTLTVSPRAKHMRVSIRNGGDVRVTVPRFVPHFLVESFMKKKASWIVETFDTAKTRPVHQHTNTRAEYEKYKEQARALAHKRVEYYTKHYQFAWGAISIRNQKTRWGSCSSKGNLNFSYKVALLPPHLADYIVVHELCHLKEFNHSDKFWNLVAETIPNHKALRKELNEWK